MTRVEGSVSLKQRVVEELQKKKLGEEVDVAGLANQLEAPREQVAKAIRELPGSVERDKDGVLRMVSDGFEPEARRGNEVIVARRFAPNPEEVRPPQRGKLNTTHRG